jgi:murein DD-endopeptidase MepM/ murein hydrolase activator NlpD
LKPVAWGLYLLSLIAALAASGAAGTAAGSLPDNLADCLRTNSGGSQALPGCEDFFALLHRSAPMIAHREAPAARNPAPRPLARPPEASRHRAGIMAAAMSGIAVPVARPQTSCLRSAAYFQSGQEHLEREGSIHHAAEAANRDARIALTMPPHCRIETPIAGEVVFAGSFAGYGGTIILLDKKGNHIVLAGFGDLDVARGDRVARGTILGRMAAQRPEALTSMFPEAPGALLYLEIRPQSGQTNPVEWLAANF